MKNSFPRNRLSFQIFLVLLNFTWLISTVYAQSFSLPMARNVGFNPNSAAVGDFNMDGKPDVAVGNTSAGSVTIALGNGDGTFISSIEYNTDLNPEGTAVGDFNKDGKLDVAVANFLGGPTNSGNITVRLGNGDGTLQAAVNYAAGSPYRLLAVDLNSDGNLDLATASPQFNKVTVLLGNGNGTFNPAVGFSVGPNPSGIAVGDFNNDGKPDLATSNYDNRTVTVLIGNGDGTFQPALFSFTSPVSSPYDLAVADLNGDAKPDIVVALNFSSFNSEIGVLIGKGDGTFNPAVPYSTTSAARLQIGDFNGDTKLDVAVVTGYNPGLVSVLRGNGDGTFQTPLTFPTQITTFDLVATDFNLDGKLDLITTNNGIARIGVLLNSPSARGTNFNATANIPANNILLATFIDYDTAKTSSSFTATINWGDGSPGTSGTIAADAGGGFRVNGSHTYAASGTYTVTIQVADMNGNFATTSANATVTKLPTVTTVSSSANPSAINKNVTFTATVTSGTGTPVGFVQFKVDNVDFGAPVALSNGGTAAISTSSLTSGQHSITAIYSGDANFNTSTGGLPSNQWVLTFAGALSFKAEGNEPNDLDFFISLSPVCPLPVSLNFTTVNGTAVAPSDYEAKSGTLLFLPGESSKVLSIKINGDSTYEDTEDFFVDFSLPDGSLVEHSRGLIINDDPTGGVIEFENATYNVAEGGNLTVKVKRSLSSNLPVDVDYNTDDGTNPSVVTPCSLALGQALDRCDFSRALGTFHFGVGETEKTFTLLIAQDTFLEGSETFQLKLSNPQGNAAIGPKSTAVVTITDDSVEPSGNANDDTDNFVRQQYIDFLNREPDSSGFQFWKNGITSCGADAGCREVKRIDTSAAFFLSIEFQETGYLVYRVFKSAYGDATSPNVNGTVPIIRFNEFMPDTQRIGEGVIVGVGTWQQKLESNKQAYTLDFVQRSRFISAFPLSMTATEFVEKLDQNAGGVLSPDERTQLISSFGSTPDDGVKRAAALRFVAEHSVLQQREFNRAFVLMQYYSYLRRDPDAAPDTDFSGWKFWVDKLDQFSGDYRRAEMVKAFISSLEYRHRFGE